MARIEIFLFHLLDEFPGLFLAFRMGHMSDEAGFLYFIGSFCAAFDGFVGVHGDDSLSSSNKFCQTIDFLRFL